MSRPPSVPMPLPNLDRSSMVLSHLFCFDREKVVRRGDAGGRGRGDAGGRGMNESCRGSQYLEIGLPMAAKENAHHSSTRRGRQSCPLPQPWYAAARPGTRVAKIQRCMRLRTCMRRAVIVNPR